MSLLQLDLLSLIIMPPLAALLLQRYYLLMVLLMLEAIILTIVMVFIMSGSLQLMVILPLLTFAVCEASVGLACLVMTTRLTGSDLFANMNLSKC